MKLSFFGYFDIGFSLGIDDRIFENYPEPKLPDEYKV